MPLQGKKKIKYSEVSLAKYFKCLCGDNEKTLLIYFFKINESKETSQDDSIAKIPIFSELNQEFHDEFHDKPNETL